MQKQAPNLARVLTMVLFALSCFGLLLFLWVAFGGSTPLKPKGYRVVIPFQQAGQLAQEADVRISGVTVGRVKKIVADSKTGKSNVTIEVKPKYAPIKRDSRVMLRLKTLLGETYVELTPGSRSAPSVPDGGQLPRGVIADSVQLDEIIRSFDEPTRRAFGVWQQQQALTGKGRGRDINDALAQFAPLEEQATELSKVLNRNSASFSRLISSTGVVFSAISEREGQLRSLIASSNRVFATTAARDQQLAQTFVALPTFQRESRPTLDRLVRFAKTTDPLVTDLKPFAAELGPTARELNRLAPVLSDLSTNLGPAVTAAKRGLPAVDSFLASATPFFSVLDPFLAQVSPLLGFVGAYPSELTAFFANITAATAAKADVDGKNVNYLRTTNPLSPEGLATYPNRLRSNRGNAYAYPRTYTGLGSATLLEYLTSQCTNGPVPRLSPTTADVFGQTLADRIKQFAFGGDDANVPASACRQQGRFTVSGKTTQFPQVAASPNPAPLVTAP